MLWIPLPNPKVMEKLEAVLESWRGTPYMAGCQAKGKGGGVDCVRFVAGVLDEMYGFKREQTPRLPPDIAMSKRGTAIATVRMIRRIYAPNVLVRDETLEPGDIVVVAQPGGGPGHALIVGPRENTLWHSVGKCVQMTGIGIIGATYHMWKYYGSYRPTDKERWV